VFQNSASLNGGSSTAVSLRPLTFATSTTDAQHGTDASIAFRAEGRPDHGAMPTWRKSRGSCNESERSADWPFAAHEGGWRLAHMAGLVSMAILTVTWQRVAAVETGTFYRP
jgi:hypothetical protein